MSGAIRVVGAGPAADAILRTLSAAMIGDTGDPAIASADLVIEASSEADPAAKRATLAALLDALPGRVPVAVVARLRTVRELLPGPRHGARVVGLHLVAPALAELTMPDAFDDAVVDAMLERLESAGLAVLPCADAPGRIVDRLVLSALLEGRAAVAGGRTTEAGLRAAMAEHGLALGAIDATAVEPVRAALHAGLGRPDRFGGTPADGAPGRITPAAIDVLSPAEVAERLELAVIAEAYRMVGDAIAGAEDIERAMTAGAGWGAGPFTLAGRRGLRGVVTAIAALGRDPAADAATRDRFAMPSLLWTIATV